MVRPYAQRTSWTRERPKPSRVKEIPYELTVNVGRDGTARWVIVCTATVKRCVIHVLEGSEEVAREVAEDHVRIEHPRLKRTPKFDKEFPPAQVFRPLPPRRVENLTPPVPGAPLTFYVSFPEAEFPGEWRVFCQTGNCFWQLTVGSLSERVVAAKEHAREHGWREQ